MKTLMKIIGALCFFTVSVFLIIVVVAFIADEFVIPEGVKIMIAVVPSIIVMWLIYFTFWGRGRIKKRMLQAKKESADSNKKLSLANNKAVIITFLIGLVFFGAVPLMEVELRQKVLSTLGWVLVVALVVFSIGKFIYCYFSNKKMHKSLLGEQLDFEQKLQLLEGYYQKNKLDQASYLNLKAFIYGETGDYEKALQFTREAIPVCPKSIPLKKDAKTMLDVLKQNETDYLAKIKSSESDEMQPP